MAQFNALNLKVNDNINIIKFNGQEIKVYNYLSIADKIDLIDISLQQAYEDGYYNDAKLEMFFNLNLVYLYTDLNFTDEEKAEPNVTYDKIVSSGLLNEIIGAMQADEYAELFDVANKVRETKEKYNSSIAGILNGLLNNSLDTLKDFKEATANIDMNQFKEVIAFAKAANGGNPVPQE